MPLATGARRVAARACPGAGRGAVPGVCLLVRRFRHAARCPVVSVSPSARSASAAEEGDSQSLAGKQLRLESSALRSALRLEHSICAAIGAALECINLHACRRDPSTRAPRREARCGLSALAGPYKTRAALRRPSGIRAAVTSSIRPSQATHSYSH